MTRYDYDDGALARDNQWVPQDMGYQAWAFDPSVISTTGNLTPGTIYAIGLIARTKLTLSKITVGIATAGSGLVAGQCLAAIYQGGTRVGLTVDQATAWASAGRADMSLTAAAVVNPGLFYVTLLANGTTGPATYRAGSSPTINSVTVTRAAFTGTGQTTLGTTLGSLSQIQTSQWVAVG